jgi:hypothetical protein
VLGAYVVVAELESFSQGQLEHFLGPGSKGGVAARALVHLVLVHLVLAHLADGLDHLFASLVHGDAQVC